MVAKGTSAKQHYGFISMSLLLLLCLGGCGKQQVAQQQISLEPEEEQALFETVTVDYGDVTLSQKIQCTYRQVEDQEVCFTVSGRIMSALEIWYIKEIFWQSLRQGILRNRLRRQNIRFRETNCFLTRMREILKMKQTS